MHGITCDVAQVCENGSCEGGADLALCARELFATCTAFLSGDDTEDAGPVDDYDPTEEGLLKDDNSINVVNSCGAHNQPLHYHTDMVCHYNANDSAVHSPPLAVMLDGRVLYGRWEGVVLLLWCSTNCNPLAHKSRIP